MIELKVFDQVYLFDTVHKTKEFILGLVDKYFGEDHIGNIDIHISEKEGNPPSLGINVGEDIRSKDVGPGQG